MDETFKTQEILTQDGKKQLPNTEAKFYFESMALYGPDMSIYRKDDKYFIGAIQKYVQQKPAEFFVDISFNSIKDAKDALMMLQWLCIIIDRKMALNKQLWRPVTNMQTNEILDSMWNGSLKESIQRLSSIYPDLQTRMFNFINKLPRG